MKDDGLFTIGQLARRTGLSTKTIRFYSDAGLVPETARSYGGYRMYDVAALARLELIRTLRDLGLGLAAIREVLDGVSSTADVVRRHVETLDGQISALTRRRAVLRAVVKREPTGEELVLMNKLAAMSDEERERVVTDYWDETFGGLDINPGFESKVRMASPRLGDDPAPVQVEAWVELAALVADPDFRARTRQMAQWHAERREAGESLDPDPEANERAQRAVARATAAMTAGVDPASAEAGPAADEVAAILLGDEAGSAIARRKVADDWEKYGDRRFERFWELLGVINGWGSAPITSGASDWVIRALRR